MSQILVNQIQYFCLHDGPGIRTTVFLQGCNLRCAWCHNPEDWVSAPSVQYLAERCIACGACVTACPAGAQRIEHGVHQMLFDCCRNCRACLSACPTGALNACGEMYTVEQLLKLLERDARLYEISGGGVTFSGGEALLQAESLTEVCGRLQADGIHTAIETALCVPWETVRNSAEHLDLFLVDFKLFDDEMHRRYTGAGNHLIIENLKKLTKIRPVAIRIPVIGMVSDDCTNAEKAAAFLAALEPAVQSVELLAYHDFGVAKASGVGRKQQSFSVPDENRMEMLREIYRASGLYVIDDRA